LEQLEKEKGPSEGDKYTTVPQFINLKNIGTSVGSLTMTAAMASIKYLTAFDTFSSDHLTHSNTNANTNTSTTSTGTTTTGIPSETHDDNTMSNSFKMNSLPSKKSKPDMSSISNFKTSSIGVINLQELELASSSSSSDKLPPVNRKDSIDRELTLLTSELMEYDQIEDLDSTVPSLDNINNNNNNHSSDPYSLISKGQDIHGLIHNKSSESLTQKQKWGWW